MSRLWSPEEYELIDVGHGRKLENFAGYVVDRPAPGISRPPRLAPWQPQARFEKQSESQGAWHCFEPTPVDWTLSRGSLTLQLATLNGGQLGVFPEHAVLWDHAQSWVEKQARPVTALNLFAYSGGLTLTLAALPAVQEVTHVDASQSAIKLARANAELSHLQGKRIRWITEDVRALVRRECRRARKYDLIVLDPPSYGHGNEGESWRIARDLPGLLADCQSLLAANDSRLILSCHTTGITPEDVSQWVRNALGGGKVTSMGLELVGSAGPSLFCGHACTWQAR